MTKEEKALLDTIAYCEGTLGVSNNGYDVVVGSKRIIAGWTKDTTIVHGGSDWYSKSNKSTAAGRYQFLYNTWIGSKGVNLPMTKDNQDKRALELAKNRLKDINISSITNRAVFNSALNRLALEWASIPVAIDFTDSNGSHKAGYSYYNDGINKARVTPDKMFEIFNLALSKY